MLRLRLPLAIAFGPIVVATYAATWAPVPNLPETQLAKDSTVRNGDTVSVWYRERKHLSAAELQLGRYRQNYDVEYNCSIRLMSYKAMQFFVSDRPDGSQISISDQTWKPISPNIEDDTVFRVVCKKRYEIWK